MKKLFYLMVTLCFLLAATPALAQTPSLVIDNERVKTDVSPQLIGGRVLVPLRVISESLGARVDWENNTKTAQIKALDKVLKLQINQTISYVNDKPIELDVPPQMVASRTMVPLRFISEQMNAEVSWLNDEKTVVVKRKAETEPAEEEKPVESPAAARQLETMNWQEGEEQASFSFQVQKGSNNVFELKNPDRIVIDLADTTLQIKEMPELNSLFVSEVNFGVHPNNTARIVLTLRDRKQVKYEVNQQQDTLTITLTRQEVAQEPTQPTPNPDGYANKVINSNSNVIFIDPGHGGKDVGAVGISGRYEKTVTLAIAQKLQSILQNKGFTVVMSHSDDAFVSLDGIAQLANASDAFCFVSVHANKAGSATATGLETYTFYGTDHTLAGLVQKEILARTGQTDRKVKESGFYVIKHTKMPAVLVETGFLSNVQEENFLFDPNNQQIIAEGIAEAISKFKDMHK